MLWGLDGKNYIFTQFITKTKQLLKGIFIYLLQAVSSSLLILNAATLFLVLIDGKSQIFTHFIIKKNAF